MNLLILSSSTGGGHNMRAYALKYWWEKQGGRAKVSHPLESSFALYRMGSNFYNLIQKYFPAFHYFYFNYNTSVTLSILKSADQGLRPAPPTY